MTTTIPQWIVLRDPLITIFSELRKQARLLENDIDMKLVAFSKLSISSNATSIDSEIAPLINSDDMFDTMSMEIQQLLNKVSFTDRHS